MTFHLRVVGAHMMLRIIFTLITRNTIESFQQSVACVVELTYICFAATDGDEGDAGQKEAGDSDGAAQGECGGMEKAAIPAW